MKFLALLCIVNYAFASETCTPRIDNCGTVELTSDSGFNQELSEY